MSSNNQVDLLEFKNMTQTNSSSTNQIDQTIENKKLMLLETMINNQKHMIELLGLVNNNLEELIIDMKDIKNRNLLCNHQANPSSISTLNTNTNNLSSNSNNNNNINNSNTVSKKLLTNNNNSTNNNINTSTSNNTNNSNQIIVTNSSHLNGLNHLNLHQLQQQSFSIDLSNNNSLVSNGLSHQQNQHQAQQSQHSQNQPNTFLTSNNGRRIENSTDEPYKPLKTGLREFSTFVSKMVRQEFGSNFLALTRINELDRYIMQKIRDEAISKYLPNGVSPQFAWNHAMNSLRQLRHRQCKKAKITL